MNVQCSGGFRSHAKETRTLKDEESSDWSLEVDNDQLRESLKLIILQLHKKLLKNSLSTTKVSEANWKGEGVPKWC